MAQAAILANAEQRTGPHAAQPFAAFPNAGLGARGALAPQVPTSKALQQAHLAACAATHKQGKKSYLDFLSASVFPALTVEEAALQWLAHRVAYMYWPTGASLSFNIQTSLGGELCDRYAAGYEKVGGVVGEAGCVAHFLKPLEAHKTCILLFRGTAAGAGRDALADLKGYPTGVPTDLADTDIGRAAFDEVALALIGQVKSWLNAYPTVTLVGHSLGGAIQARLLAHLPPQLQQRVLLRSYGAPGLEEGTAAKIVPCLGNVGGVWDVGDWVTAAGGRHAPGVYTEVGSVFDPGVGALGKALDAHVDVPLVRWQLGEATLKGWRGFAPAPDNTRVAEDVRGAVAAVVAETASHLYDLAAPSAAPLSLRGWERGARGSLLKQRYVGADAGTFVAAAQDFVRSTPGQREEMLAALRGSDYHAVFSGLAPTAAPDATLGQEVFWMNPRLPEPRWLTSATRSVLLASHGLTPCAPGQVDAAAASMVDAKAQDLTQFARYMGALGNAGRIRSALITHLWNSSGLGHGLPQSVSRGVGSGWLDGLVHLMNQNYLQPAA